MDVMESSDSTMLLLSPLFPLRGPNRECVCMCVLECLRPPSCDTMKFPLLDRSAGSYTGLERTWVVMSYGSSAVSRLKWRLMYARSAGPAVPDVLPGSSPLITLRV